MKILIVDDHPYTHTFLDGVLRGVFGEVTLEFASTLAMAMEKASNGAPFDLVVLDLGMPDSSGVATFARFHASQPETRVMVFSANDEPPTMIGTLNAGASGFLPKSSTPQVIAAALRLVMAGGVYVPPQLMVNANQRAPNGDISLTTRQTDVLRLILRGMANKEIANLLLIAEGTVKQHARAAYAALGVSSRSQAMRAAVQRGIQLE
jgi:DNA-binding NarL/FixJ family response regulator